VATSRNSRVLLLPLVDKLLLASDGSTTFSYRELKVEGVSDILPYAERIFAITYTENRTVNHLWNVFFISAYTRSAQGSTFNALLADINSNGSLRGADFTDATKFQLDTRVLLGCKNSAGAAVEQAMVSATLGVVLLA
jgi:hypothetical protein